jgi:2-keto-3-deoxy-L-rhamnonate aldolase RhmA
MAAMNGSDTLPMVRVASNDPVIIKRVLDIGAYGVLIPLVNSAQEAMNAVRYCKYPPEGVRGVAPRRVAWFDPRYLETANEEIMVIPQIETAQAAENVDEILSVKGIDCIFIGPSDLSGSLGLIGQPDRLRHPKNLETIDRVVKAARRARIPVATTSTLYPANKLVEQGYNMILAGSDVGFLRNGANELLKSLR